LNFLLLANAVGAVHGLQIHLLHNDNRATLQAQPVITQALHRLFIDNQHTKGCTYGMAIVQTVTPSKLDKNTTFHSHMLCAALDSSAPADMVQSKKSSHPPL
jgi:hypothetical protein